MGSSSKSSSNSTSSETTDSYNTTLTNSLSGQGDLGLNTGAITGDISGLSYAYGSNNPVTNNDQMYNLGAGDSSSNSAGQGAGGVASSSGGIDWSQVLIWIVGGVALMIVLRYGFGDKNA